MHCIYIRFRSGTDNHSGVVMKEFEYDIEIGNETLTYKADISLFVNEDYEGNKYPEVEYDDAELWLSIYSETLDDVVTICLETEAHPLKLRAMYAKHIVGNKELEQAALEQLTGD